MRVRGRMLVRSAGVRFALIYAALFCISAVALVMLLWWSTAGLLGRETDAAINADTQGLHERYTEGGLLAVGKTIEQRIDQNVDDDAIYLLASPQLQPIAGNLDHWPQRVALDADWAMLPVDRAGIREIARVHQYVLEGGFRLLVGRDVQVAQQMTRLLADALIWAAAVVLVLGIAGALTVRSLFRLTLADVSAVASAIGAGDLGRRVRVTGRGDEFDRLAETINDMLDRIGRLMDGVRQVSNAIAHDLRTPIARARARLEDAARPGATETELRAAIERAQSDLDGVVRVFQALLRIAEIETGARRSAFTSLDLSPLLLDLAELYRGSGGGGAADAGARNTSASAGLRRPGDDPAGGGQPARQRDQVLLARRSDPTVGRARGQRGAGGGGRPGAGHPAAGPGARGGAVLSWRERAQHSRLRPGADPGAGGGGAA